MLLIVFVTTTESQEMRVRPSGRRMSIQRPSAGLSGEDLNSIQRSLTTAL
jgi:hypothetical protein